MADNSLNQVVLDAFRQANGNAKAESNIQAVIQNLLPASGETFSSALTDASRQIDALRSANQALAEVIHTNTQAVQRNSSAQSGDKSVVERAGGVAGAVFGSGLGLVPLVTSLAHLFGGSKSERPPTLIPYTPPAALRLDLADTTARPYTGMTEFAPLTYGQNGLPRVARDDSRPAAPQQVAAPQISIQVNALDSRSFMDRSHEIAQAVRQAMLNMHSLNDVVSDL
jgi:hypothetical protein